MGGRSTPVRPTTSPPRVARFALARGPPAILQLKPPTVTYTVRGWWEEKGGFAGGRSYVHAKIT